MLSATRIAFCWCSFKWNRDTYFISLASFFVTSNAFPLFARLIILCFFLQLLFSAKRSYLLCYFTPENTIANYHGDGFLVAGLMPDARTFKSPSGY